MELQDSDSMHSTSGKSREFSYSLTKSNYNISNGVQLGGRVVLAIDRCTSRMISCWLDLRH